jgi:hypothetical protein
MVTGRLSNVNVVFVVLWSYLRTVFDLELLGLFGKLRETPDVQMSHFERHRAPLGCSSRVHECRPRAAPLRVRRSAIVSNAYLWCALRLLYQDMVLTLKNTSKTLIQGNRPGGDSNA